MLLLWYSLPPIADQTAQAHVYEPVAVLDEDDEIMTLLAHFEFYE